MAEITKFKSPAAPNLPIAPTVYTGQHFDILNNVLRLYFNQLDGFNNAVIANVLVPNAGSTADRPTINLQIGQQYFDTTLGLPIWWNGTDWIDAAGTVV
jgi:hypothetical protein